MPPAALSPQEKTAFAVATSPGVYALLLGSGVSTGAGVPTGYDIVSDLASRLARLRGATPTDPVRWFREEFGEPAEYSTLVEQFGATPAERRNLIREYIEPSEADRAAGHRVPSPAHRAIARLVALGCVRVIATTNFDALLETAIRDEGINPQVISTPDAVKGALPLAHATCTVVKLNGDYLDTRIRNTGGELDVYPSDIASLLDQVLREYGLIVCGWSADWDHALVAAIERAPRLFSTFWCIKGEASPRTRSLLALRPAIDFAIDTADEFFATLAGLVETLRKSDRSHPESFDLFVASAKREVAAERYVDLLDRAREETAKVLAQVRITEDRLSASGFKAQGLASLVEDLDTASERLVVLGVLGCSWAGDRTEDMWLSQARTIIAAASAREQGGELVWARELRKYCAVRCIFSWALTALRSGQLALVAKLLKLPAAVGDRGETLFLLSEHAYAVQVSGSLRPGSTAFPDLIFESIRPHVAKGPVDAHEYEHLFDVLEFGLAVMTANVYPWMGRFSRLVRMIGPAANELVEQYRSGEMSGLREHLIGGVIEDYDARVKIVLDRARAMTFFGG